VEPRGGRATTEELRAHPAGRGRRRRQRVATRRERLRLRCECHCMSRACALPLSARPARDRLSSRAVLPAVGALLYFGLGLARFLTASLRSLLAASRCLSSHPRLAPVPCPCALPSPLCSPLCPVPSLVLCPRPSALCPAIALCPRCPYPPILSPLGRLAPQLPYSPTGNLVITASQTSGMPLYVQRARRRRRGRREATHSGAGRPTTALRAGARQADGEAPYAARAHASRPPSADGDIRRHSTATLECARWRPLARAPMHSRVSAPVPPRPARPCASG
jgi:hypothetical protein